MKHIVFLVTVGLGGLAAEASTLQVDPSSEVFDPNVLNTYRLTMAPGDWSAIVNTPQNQTVWYRAQLTWKGEVWNDVAVRPGGNSVVPGYPKPLIRLDFDEFVAGRKFHGLSSFRLDGMHEDDGAQMSERLYYSIHRDFGVKAPRYVHCRLYVNGQYTGLYGVEERVNGGFARMNFDPANVRQIYKWVMEAGMTVEQKNMSWRGTDPALYVPRPFEPTIDDLPPAADGVRDLLSILNNTPSQASQVFNVGSFIRLLAVDCVTMNRDGYLDGDPPGTARTINNIKLCRNPLDNNRWVIVPWDPSLRFKGGSVYETLPLTWSFENLPVTQRVILDNAANLQAYRQRLRELIDGPYEITRVRGIIDSIQSQINQAVIDDPNRRITHAEFLSNVATLKSFAQARVNSVRQQLSAYPTVTVAAVDASASEPGADTGSFRITRTGSTTASLAVTFGVTGTATAGTDYNTLAASATIPAGSASATVTVTPRDDAVVEGQETVILTLSPGAAFLVGTPSSATVMIADNDTVALPAVTIAATDGSAAEPSSVGVFTITRSGSTGGSLAVTLNRAGTASSGTDYTGVGTSVTIAAGQASVALTVTPVDDGAVEGNETVILTISAGAGYAVGSPSSATVTIADDDAAGAATVSFQDGVAPTAAYAGTWDTTLSEGSPAANLGTDGSLRFDGDQTAGSDLVTLLRFNLSSIPSGSAVQSATITVNVTNPSADVYQVYEARRNWVETEATWTSYAAGSAWQAAGAQGSLDRGTTVLGTLAPTAAGSVVLTLNGAGRAVIESWVNLPATNYGFVIANASNTDGGAFQSREAAAPAGRPRLSVAYAPGAAGTGLSATYYDNADFTGTSVTRTDPRVDFDWQGGSPAPAIGGDTFSSRWTGRVRAQYSEIYTFYTFTNDGVRLWVEGENLVDHWVVQSGGLEWSGQIALEAGKSYTIQMDHYENTGSAVARLSWSSPSISKQVIPQSALDPTLGPTDARDNDGDGTPNDADLDDDNDGIPDLQDSDRDGDGASNGVEAAGGTDPDDRTSTLGIAGGGGGGDGDGGSSCGATGVEAVLLWVMICALVRRRARVFSTVKV